MNTNTGGHPHKEHSQPTSPSPIPSLPKGAPVTLQKRDPAVRADIRKYTETLSPPNIRDRHWEDEGINKENTNIIIQLIRQPHCDLCSV